MVWGPQGQWMETLKNFVDRIHELLWTKSLIHEISKYWITCICWKTWITIGKSIFRINFWGFRRYLHNLENIYPQQILLIKLLETFRIATCACVTALWKYFKCEVKTPLQSPNGSLTRVISFTGIAAANREVQQVMETNNNGTMWKRRKAQIENMLSKTE